MVHRLSGGIPRIINVICDAALVFGYAEERRVIDRTLVQEVVQELELSGVLKQYRPPTRKAAGPPESAAADVPAAPVQALVGGPALESPGVAARAAEVGDGLRQKAAPLVAALEAELMEARRTIEAREAELGHQRDLMARHLSDLEAREDALGQRERQIAEQRRIMNDEYRLLRQRYAGALAPAAAAMTGLTALPAAAASRPGPGASPRLPRRIDGRTQDSRLAPFWHRILRLFAREPAL
jgi:hypothetical protein